MSSEIFHRIRRRMKNEGYRNDPVKIVKDRYERRRPKSIWETQGNEFLKHPKTEEEFHYASLLPALIRWLIRWLIRSQMRWTGHIIRMPQSRMPFQLLYGELSEGKRNRWSQRKRSRTTLKANMKKCAIHSERLEQLASDRNDWRSSISSGIAFLENQPSRNIRLERTDEQPPCCLHNHRDFKCDICGQPCRSRIGLWSHKTARHRP